MQFKNGTVVSTLVKQEKKGQQGKPFEEGTVQNALCGQTLEGLSSEKHNSA